MIAALFVATNGVYYGIEDVDPWDEARDARLYEGPWPVVAHPPCQRWGRYWYGGPSIKVRKKMGDDGGCFASALASVRRWGGVLEHPEASHAWKWHGLTKPPRNGGWIPAGDGIGWTCCVEQGCYGHRARKATWLYAVRIELPMLQWTLPKWQKMARLDDGFHSTEERRMFTRPPKNMSAEMRAKRHKWLERRAEVTGIDWCAPERLTKTERIATPVLFRNLLLDMARSVGQP